MKGMSCLHLQSKAMTFSFDSLTLEGENEGITFIQNAGNYSYLNVTSHPRKLNLNRFEIIWNANLMQKRWFYWCILSVTCFGYVRPSSGALDVELQHMVFCTEFLDGWWSSLLRRSCVQCRWCRAVPCTVQTTYAAALKTTTHPKTRCRKPYAATQHLMLLMMGACTWNMSS